MIAHSCPGTAEERWLERLWVALLLQSPVRMVATPTHARDVECDALSASRRQGVTLLRPLATEPSQDATAVRP
jgi:hypothetical protein